MARELRWPGCCLLCGAFSLVRSNGPVDTQQRWYFGLMGTCILLLALAWFLVRLWSVPWAIGMSAVAAFLPPIAVIVGNSGRPR